MRVVKQSLLRDKSEDKNNKTRQPDHLPLTLQASAARNIVQWFVTMEPRHEIIQLAIAATPLMIAVLVMLWSPSSQSGVRLKGVIGAVLLFLPFWFIGSATGSCTALARFCAPGEELVRLNPPYWGIGSWDCEQCAGNISTLFIGLNSWRPPLVGLCVLLTIAAGCLVLRQCWRFSSRLGRQ